MKSDFFSKKLALILSVVLLTTTLFACLPVVSAQVQNEDDLIAYYSFDDVNGTTVPDKSGNGHNGTVSGAELTVGKVGTAISFNKAGDGVTVPHSEDLNFAETDSYTISFWVKPEELSAWQCVIAKNRTISPAREYMGLWFNGNRFTYCQGTDGSAWFDNPRYEGAENGIWYNVVMVQDASQNKSMMYLNGEQVIQKNYTKASSGSGALQMGSYNGTGGEQFYGSLDEVKIYSTALSVTEIKTNYNNDLLKDAAIAYWSFDDISGTTVTDLSGNGHNGTINGAETTVGKLGSAISFDASGDHVKVPHSDKLNFSENDSYTVSFWVKPKELGNWQCVLAKNRTINPPRTYMGFWFDGNRFAYCQGT
ncbi:MAG: laminin G domain-containing protein, partial [Clostridia bacterium]|nr:laminin G domain-containing protein [Clostridia bacterium]